jgi:hypothetical protein
MGLQPHPWRSLGTRTCSVATFLTFWCSHCQHQAWPRTFETFGEDPYLISEMVSVCLQRCRRCAIVLSDILVEIGCFVFWQGAQIIQGYQGNGTAAALGQTNKVAACMKHFIGSSANCHRLRVLNSQTG